MGFRNFSLIFCYVNIISIFSSLSQANLLNGILGRISPLPYVKIYKSQNFALTFLENFVFHNESTMD